MFSPYSLRFFRHSWVSVQPFTTLYKYAVLHIVSLIFQKRWLLFPSLCCRLTRYVALTSSPSLIESIIFFIIIGLRTRVWSCSLPRFISWDLCLRLRQLILRASESSSSCKSSFILLLASLLCLDYWILSSSAPPCLPECSSQVVIQRICCATPIVFSTR